MSKSLMLCVDASMVMRLVAVPYDETVEALFDSWQDIQLVAPSLLLYEVTNALHRYHRAGYFGSGDAKDALRAALAIPIDYFADTVLHIEARQIAEELSLPATYDAHYLALSKRLGIEFWTADRKLANIAHKSGLDWVNCYEAA